MADVVISTTGATIASIALIAMGFTGRSQSALGGNK